MFPSTFQRTMFPSFLGLHVTSSCSQPLEMRKRGRGEYTTARHTYNPFQSPTPGGKGRKGEEERKVGREKRTSTQSLHMIPTHTFTTPPHHSSPPHFHHTPSPLIPTTHLPTFNTHPYHSHPPPSPFTLSIPPLPSPPLLPSPLSSLTFSSLSSLIPPRTLPWTRTSIGCTWQPTTWSGISRQAWLSSRAENLYCSALAPTSRMLSPLLSGYVPGFIGQGSRLAFSQWFCKVLTHSVYHKHSHKQLPGN